MTAHAKLSASSSKRWLTCPGSVKLSEGIPDSTSAAAHEGSAAHALAEHCLLQGEEPFEYLGESHPDPEYQDVPIDAGMVDAVAMYVNWVRSYGTSDKIDKNRIEQRVSLEPLGDWAKGMFGTADHIYWSSPQRCLYVDDYKHGVGVLVEPDSPQLKYYAVGALLKGKVLNVAEYVQMSIIQPRAHHVNGPTRTIKYSVEDLMRWVTEELEPGVKATKRDDAPLVPDEDACKFCPAKGKCPALRDKALEMAMIEFDDQGAAQSVKPMDQLTPEEISSILDNAKFIEKWLDGVKSFAKGQLEARQDVTAGRYKLVAGKNSRSWKNVTKAVEYLQGEAGLKDEDLFTQKMVTPAQAEKLVAKDLKEGLAAFISVTAGGPTMVPASDKRKSIMADAADDFVQGEDTSFLD